MKKEIALLLVLSILVGSALAASLSLASNAYFAKTIANLVGESGEYDVIITAREEMKEDTSEHLAKMIQESIPGAKFKEGPTLSGKTSFFVALPEALKNKQTYNSLGKLFGSIPGGAGVGVLTEPRITIRGVPEGAKNQVMEQVDALEGVQFSFYDGAAIGVLLRNASKTADVTNQIKSLLDRYQIMEISFPVGSEPANPIRTGEQIGSAMEQTLKLPLAQNVSIDGKNDDMTYMVSTMMEMKRFLQSYAAKLVISPAGLPYKLGDTLLFQGNAPTVPNRGEAVGKEHILAVVTAVRGDGSAEAAITQGDGVNLKSLQAYRVDQNVIGEAAGGAQYQSPRLQLASALTETGKLVGQIPDYTRDAKALSQTAYGALDQYNASLDKLDQTLKSVRSAGRSVEQATSGLIHLNTDALVVQLDSSAQAMGNIASVLQVLKLVSADAGNAATSAATAQAGLTSIKNTVQAMGNLAGQARAAQSAVDSVSASGQAMLDDLRRYDTAGARRSLDQASNSLNRLQQLDTPLITSQLAYLAAAVPNMKDDEITHTVTLLDKFIAGQVIPGARIQILTTNTVSTDAIVPIAAKIVGHNNLSVYSTALGVIEPDPRGQILSVLAEVKAILAGLAACVFTVVFLVLDHTALMSALKRRMLTGKWGLLGKVGYHRL